MRNIWRFIAVQEFIGIHVEVGCRMCPCCHVGNMIDIQWQ